MKRRLKQNVVVALYLVFTIFLGVSLIIIQKNYKESVEPVFNVGNEVINKEIPVINIEKVLSKPYNVSDIEIINNFYDVNADVDSQTKSIIVLNDTYIPSRGVIYGKDTSFEVIAIYDGEVVNVEKTDILGNLVEVRHTNNIVSVYQLLDNVSVNKGDIIKQGDIIGTSSLSDIIKDNKYKLYFELIVNGDLVNPEKFYNKKIGEI